MTPTILGTMKQALEDLRDLCDDQREQFDELAYPIRAAIKAMEDAEPVAFLGYKPLHNGTYKVVFAETRHELRGVDATKPLYTLEQIKLHGEFACLNPVGEDYAR